MALFAASAAKGCKFSHPLKTAPWNNASNSSEKRLNPRCTARGNSGSIVRKFAKSFLLCYRTNNHERTSHATGSAPQKLWSEGSPSRNRSDARARHGAGAIGRQRQRKDNDDQMRFGPIAAVNGPRGRIWRG